MNSIIAVPTRVEAVPATLDQIDAAIPMCTTPEHCASLLAVAEAVASFVALYHQPQADLVEAARRRSIRVKHRLGELLKGMPKNPGGKPKTKPETYVAGLKPAALADLGISKSVSRDAQKLADLPGEAFEKVVAGEVSLAAATRALTANAPKPKPKKEAVEPVEKPPTKAEAKTIAKLEGQVADLTQQLRETESELRDAHETIATLGDTIAALEAHRDGTVEALVADLNAEIIKLARRNGDLQDKNNELVSHERKQAALVSKLRRLTRSSDATSEAF